MSDRYIVFVEVHSHNLRHFLHQQRWAVISTTGIPVISRHSLRAYCSSSSNLTSTLKPSLPSLFMSSLIYLIWLFTPSLRSFTSLIVDTTGSYFFEMKFWDFSISSNPFLRSRRLALSESISLRFPFGYCEEILLPTALLNFPQLNSCSGLNSVQLNS